MTEQKPRIVKPKPAEKTDGGLVEFASEVMERTGGAALAVLFATVALPLVIPVIGAVALREQRHMAERIAAYRNFEKE